MMKLNPIVRVLERISGPARLQILIFHRVLAEPDPLFPDVPDARRFRELVRMFKRLYRVLPLGEALDQLRDQQLPAGSAALTFDDGYEDNYSVALPILKDEGVPATIFVATRFLDGGRMFNDTVWESFRHTTRNSADLDFIGLGQVAINTWDDRRRLSEKVIDAIKYMDLDGRERAAERVAVELEVSPRSDLMMSSEQVARLPAECITVGAHTHSHPILTRLAPAEARADIVRGRVRLEQIRGEPIELFAYPNGVPGRDYARVHVDMVRDLGFRAAVTTAPGVHVRTGDYYQIPRFTPWRHDLPRFAVMMLGNSRRLQPQTA